MTDLTSIASNPAIVTAIAIVIGGGGLAFWMKYSTKILFAEKHAEEAHKKADVAHAKTDVLESRVNQQDTIVNEIRARMSKLDDLPQAVASLMAAAKFIEEAVKQIVPRSEQEANRQSIEQRFARIEEDLRILKEQRTN